MRSIKAFPRSVLAGALLCSTAFLCSSVLPAQNSAVVPRITTDVDESSLTTLKGNVPGRARAEYDQGEASSSTQLTYVRLVLARSSEQQAALDEYMAELQDKSSPNYHKWLTPQQFGQLYGPADSDIAALVAWLQSHGLTVETLSLGRTNIAFSGTVSQVEEAFHTSIHSFQANANEDQFTSNTTDPRIPSALAAVVIGVAHLNTIRPQPFSVRGNLGRINPQTRRLEQADALSANGARPELTETGPDFLYIVPGDAATIYDTPNSFNANFNSGTETSYTGAGVKIGVGGDATISASIVADYRSVFLGNSTQPSLNYCTSSSSCSTTAGSGYVKNDEDEAYIDTELSGGMAPGAAIYYYASTDLTTGIEAAIDANVVDIFSLSFGDCEANMGSNNAQIKSLWEQAATQGITVTVSSADSGSAGCDYNVTEAIGGLQVSGYASTPYNIAVGGTDFYALTNSFSTYVNTAQEGTSANNYDYYRTALSYIPESTWNDSTTTDTTISANIASTNTCATSKTTTNILAGSGGASSCATGSGATCAGYPKPAWQTGTGVPADGVRDIPDVSLMAGNGCDPATWLICSADTTKYNNQTVTEDCATQSDGYFFFVGYGGTSTSAPTFAGILAMVEQKAGGRLGQAAAELQQLYTLANGAHASSVFHDVTVGNISVPCKSGSPNCVMNTAGYYFETGYNALTGYDLATGLGSVDATQLVNDWSSSTSSAAATVTVTPTPNPVTTVESLSVPVSVSGSSGTPTGTVTLSGGGYISTAKDLVGGSYTFSVAAGSLAIGVDTLTVTYSGDTTYAATNKTATVTVTGLTAAVTANPTPTSINSNQTVTVTGTVTCTGTCTGSTTPTGTVTLTGGGYTSQATALSGGSYSITIPANTFSTTETVTLTVTYNGNSIYDAGAFGTTTVGVTSVTVLTPTVTVIPATSTLDSSQSLNVTVTVAGAGATPTGTVTLASGSYTSGPQTLAGSGTCTAALCTIIIPANSLNSSLGGSNDTLTATYSGDVHYFSGSGTALVTVTSSVFSVSATTPAAIAPGVSTTSTVTASSSLFYSGTVTLGCVLTSYPNGASYLPYCSFTSGSPVTLSGTTTSGTATATVYTTAASAALVYPRLPGRGQGNGRGLFGAGGGAVLAFLVFLGIPTRRRSWRSMLGVLVVMAALGSLAGCGGVSGGGGNLQPTISSLSPNSAVPGGSGFTLTIYGTNFTSTATAYWGATPLTTTYVSTTQLTAVVPAPLIAINNAGTTPSVTVATANGTSSGATFSIGTAGTTAGTYIFTVTGNGNPVVTPAPTTTFTVIVN